MKLRIISGHLGGRYIEAPSGHTTHPMSEKIRGALFNMLGDISGLSILDAYAGSGAVAIEAISRGAKHIVAIDKDRTAYQTIQNNIALLDINSIKVSRANIRSWLENNQDKRFDVVVCDPPYDDIKQDVLYLISEFVAENGIIVYSIPPATNIDLPSGQFKIAASKTYGDAKLMVYQRKTPSNNPINNVK